MRLLAIDPGPEKSALLAWGPDGVRLGDLCGVIPNADVAWLLSETESGRPLVIEWIHHMGMPAGAELFDTCRWVGRFQQAYRGPVVLLSRRDIKLAICGSARATDANIRQALIDRFGGKEKAIGNRRAPGPLYGIKSHLWSALAVAVAYTEMQAQK